jgi:transcriptional regulator with XRE-family HTH domain
LTCEEPDPLDLAIGERIRARRMDLSLTQRAFAAALGVSVQQVQKYESGRNRVAASTLVRAAARLQTTVADLVGESAGKPIMPLSGLPPVSAEARQLLAAYAGTRKVNLRREMLETVQAAARAGDQERWARLGCRNDHG